MFRRQDLTRPQLQELGPPRMEGQFVAWLQIVLARQLQLVTLISCVVYSSLLDTTICVETFLQAQLDQEPLTSQFGIGKT